MKQCCKCLSNQKFIKEYTVCGKFEMISVIYSKPPLLSRFSVGTIKTGMADISTIAIILKISSIKGFS